MIWQFIAIILGIAFCVDVISRTIEYLNKKRLTTWESKRLEKLKKIHDRSLTEKEQQEFVALEKKLLFGKLARVGVSLLVFNQLKRYIENNFNLATGIFLASYLVIALLVRWFNTYLIEYLVKFSTFFVS